jgi:SAM-dependent methyltransferase
MRDSVQEYTKEMIRKIDFDDPVLDTCAGWEPNMYEPLFPGRKYLKHDIVDFDPPCIDIISPVWDMKQVKNNSIGLVLHLEAIHHVEYPQKTLDEIYRILKPNGYLILSTHMYWEIMAYPNDYWRFCPQGLEFLLQRFQIVDFTMEGNPNLPSGLWVTVQKLEDENKKTDPPKPRYIHPSVSPLWYWLVKRPLEKFFKLEIRRIREGDTRTAEKFLKRST